MSNPSLPPRATLPPPRRRGRALTVFAVGFLLLDGMLLLLAGWWSGRWGLIFWGVTFAAGAAMVFAYWRRYQRQLRDIRQSLETRYRELRALEGAFRRSEPD